MESSAICNVFPTDAKYFTLLGWVSLRYKLRMPRARDSRRAVSGKYILQTATASVRCGSFPLLYFFAAARFHRHAETSLLFLLISFTLPFPFIHTYYFKFLSELANETRLSKSKWLEKSAPAADGPFISFVTDELKKTWISLLPSCTFR